MEQVSFEYSMKNIPIPTNNAYMKQLIEKVESLNRRMRWKALLSIQKTKIFSTLTKNDQKALKGKTSPPMSCNQNAEE